MSAPRTSSGPTGGAPRGHGGGAAREGTALLQGRIRCGRCGRMMQVGYSGTTGNTPRYLCGRNKLLYGGERGCQSLGGRRLENRVLDEVFAMLEPASLAATAKALAEADANHRRHVAVFELAVERARFEAERARRQFDAVEPENRLVARTLERSLEEALGGATTSRGRTLPPNGSVSRPGSPRRRRRGWSGPAPMCAPCSTRPTTTWRERKQLLRAIITEVVVTVHAEERRAEVTIVWEGGADRGVRPRPQQDRQALPNHRRGHRRPRSPSGRALRRQDDRRRLVETGPANRNRPSLHQDTSQDPPRLTGHRRVSAAGRHTRRR